jgi:hypothetical protein
MTVVMQQTMPEGMTIEFLDEVTRQLGVLSDPPEGLIVHTHFAEGGRIRIIDVWDSAQAFDTFRDGRLMPTMEKVAADAGMDLTQAPQPETTVTEVAGLVRGR